ncbi:MAG: flagellar protein FlgJ [Gammaproteobacteria bacterium]|jgi:flagellar protein FlgJ
MENIAQTSAFTDISRFGALRADAKRGADSAIDQVAKEFEALFIQQMLKAAREASVEGGLFNSRDLKLFREMMDSQIALSMADQGGLGFADVLRGQLGFDSTETEIPAHQLPQAIGLPSRSASLPAAIAPSIEPTSKVGTVEHETIATSGKIQSSERSDDFVRSLLPEARKAATKLGLDPNILIAQAALETGWGRHTIADANGRSSNNYFAIKANSNWGGDRVDVQTLEYIDKRPVRINAQFRAYADAASAFEDYVAFLQDNRRYAAALQHGGDSRKFVTGLQDAGYATDPAYATKILALKGRITAQSMHAAK